jgi:type I restriction enzyme S subunit
MSEWRPLKMADVMAEFYDGPHATPPPADDGPVYLGIKNITDSGVLDLSEVRHIAEEDFGRWTKRVTPQPGDIVFTYEATLHRYALIPDGFRGCLGRRLALIRPNRSVVDPRYLHMAMLGPVWRATVTERIISGSTVDRVPIITFPDFPISLPPLAIQERIAETLGSIDDLIENNRRRVDLLEEMARAIYREWFVRFRYPGLENVPLVGSPLGQIPEGWRPTNLGGCASALVDGDWIETKDQGGCDFRLLQVSNIGVGRFRETGKSRYVTAETFDRLRCTAINAGDILISRMPDPVGRAWLVDYLPEPAITAVDVAILTPRSNAIGSYLNQVLNSSEHLAWAETVSTGTTRKRVTRSVLSQAAVLLPDDDALERYYAQTTGIRSMSASLRGSERALVAIRDTLLPRLVSGQIDVSDLDLDALTEAATR